LQEPIEFAFSEDNTQNFKKICPSDSVRDKKGIYYQFENEIEIAIFRENGLLYAVSNICPHQHSSVLHKGYVEDCTITCPLHGWMYSLKTGKALGGGASIKVYSVFERDGFIFVEIPTIEEPSWAKNL
jgi:nitrite reductase/ring-hydroxylating ferredoxin subunit